jgi:hypothetical protein
MLLTIAFILLIMVALAALELRLFWQLGERDDRRRMREHAAIGRPVRSIAGSITA